MYHIEIVDNNGYDNSFDWNHDLVECLEDFQTLIKRKEGSLRLVEYCTTAAVLEYKNDELKGPLRFEIAGSIEGLPFDILDYIINRIKRVDPKRKRSH